MGETPTYSINDARFGVRPDGTVYLSQSGSIDYETEPEVRLIGAARLSDGRIATQSFVLTVVDDVERFRGTGASDELVGTTGRDVVEGIAGDDTLWGRAGDDLLEGGSGSDGLLGEAGHDTLEGGAGADTLSGGSEDGQLEGGAGADMFVFREDEGFDTVTDFRSGLDKIVLVGTATFVLGSSGGSALVDFGGTEVLLEDVDPASVSADDFLLVESLG